MKYIVPLILLTITSVTSAQTLEEQLLKQSPAELAADALKQGDASRGAVVFYQPFLACRQCHTAEEGQQQLGPDLTKLSSETNNAHLVESMLKPSAVVAEKYKVVNLLTAAGKKVSGLVVNENKAALTIRDAANSFKPTTIPRNQIEERSTSSNSLMPAGQVNMLASKQQFLDLVRYLIALRDGGPAAAEKLMPPAALFAARPLPEYEKKIDHAGMISKLGDEHFKRGEAIYKRLCINCHGDHDKPGSLPTSLRFASGKFKNGNDPYTMYQTLTRGFGMMVAQSWMVPQQKYDVIHYIRQAYLKEHNPTQLFKINGDYLASLPPGDTFGPEPSKFQPWNQMDYGPNLIATYEIGNDAKNFAYKGNAIRLDAGPGGVSRGRYWMIYDYDTLRVAAGYSGEGFIDYNGINFNGRHNIHPRIVGDVHFQNPTGPGWAKPGTTGQSPEDFADPRMLGRDDRAYGPLPKSWAKYRGMYAHGADTIVQYMVGKAEVLELPAINNTSETPAFVRTFNISPHDEPLVLRVARGKQSAPLNVVSAGMVAVVGGAAKSQPQASSKTHHFNGATSIQLPGDAFNMHDRDFTISARVKTTKGGTIFSKTAASSKWVHDGKAFFIRGGRLVFDIGWVGAVQSNVKVADGKWHNVAVTYRGKNGEVTLFVDGKEAGDGILKPEEKVAKHVVRIGYAAPDFPRGQSFFNGEMENVRFTQSLLSVKDFDSVEQPLASWQLSQLVSDVAKDSSGNEHHGKIITGKPVAATSAGDCLVAGLAGDLPGAKWSQLETTNDLLLTIAPAKSPQRFSLWVASLESSENVDSLLDSLVINRPTRDLVKLTHGGPSRWPEVLTTQASVGAASGPFAIDVLTRPEQNPWFCRLRLTGVDFYEDGDSAVVSAWDGSIWLVEGLKGLEEAAKNKQPTTPITWRRIASGLFQPLGVKIVDGELFVTCRDQLCRLHDFNDDGEIDYYESFNNDHQVTDHFHEFAMGLQTDDEGNFYYAKSARHALKALVPHHGTLLKITKDGSKTEIIANGFRAANGVCLNPDGTFIVTDQEGHWNPKNRINWVKPGGFYGNMFGYHDVTDSRDSAMDQPLCWITNAFDRSPAELLWVKSKRWGELNGRLLNLSYGYGKVYVVPHEDVNGQKQGGMVQLPIPNFPTGVMRGRFHPSDGQLYLVGMFAWAGNQQQPGGFYRLRKTTDKAHLPVELSANKNGVAITFSNKMQRESAERIENYNIKVWSLKRTANYGSKHYDEHSLKVTAAKLSPDGKTVQLTIPEIEPTWCMEIKYQVSSDEGKPIEGVIHNTIHELK